MGYWDNKTELADRARKHTFKMQEVFASEIAECIEKTKVYDTKVMQNLEFREPQETVFSVVDEDSVSAIMKRVGSEFKGKTAVLNFASFQNPGGKFIEGSKAQEECLCHSSFLYNVLVNRRDFYNENSQMKNKGLYSNRALYSPDVIFMADGSENKKCDVITCAAPNKIPYYRYNAFTNPESC